MGQPYKILVAGVGGQGVLTLAEILAKAALAEGLNVRVGEIHGMAQRGGHVVCTVRIGDDASGPIIDAGAADLRVRQLVGVVVEHDDRLPWFVFELNG